MQISSKFIAFSALLCLGCAPTFHNLNRVSKINVCPQYSLIEDSLELQLLQEKISEISNKKTGYVVSNNCDSIQYPSLIIKFSKTYIPSQTNRNVSGAITGIGLAVGIFTGTIYLITDSNFKLFVVFWWIPKNKTILYYEYTDNKYKVDNSSKIKTVSFSKKKEVNLKKQIRYIGYDISETLDSLRKM